MTNPPIDPFREKIVMSLLCPIGPESNILEPNELQVHRLFLPHPIVSLQDLEVIKHTTHRGWKTKVIDITYPVEDGPDGLLKTLHRVDNEANQAAREGYQLIVLSDRQAGAERYIMSPVAKMDNLCTLCTKPLFSHFVKGHFVRYTCDNTFSHSCDCILASRSWVKLILVGKCLITLVS